MKHLVPVLLSVLVLASCGKAKSPGGAPGPGGGSPADPSPGGASPQEAFEKARSAGTKMDFGGLYDIVCPDERDGQVFSSMMGGAFTAGEDAAKVSEYDAIRKKHGIPDSPTPPNTDTTSREGMKALSEKLKDVRDKRGFVVEAGAFVNKYSKPGNDLLMDGTLKDVKETGDNATATFVDLKKAEFPIRFRKVEGRWYVSMLEK